MPVPNSFLVFCSPNKPIYIAVPSVVFSDIVILVAITKTTTTTAFPLPLYYPPPLIGDYFPIQFSYLPLMLRFDESGCPPGFSGTPYH